jgi:PAS domain S-box-containing protein
MTGNEIKNSFHSFDKVLWMGIGLGLFYWVGESLLHVVVFREGDLAAQIMTQNPHEIWKRLTVLSLIIAFSVYAHLKIYERQKAEEALKVSENKYRTIFEDALNPIFLFDENGHYIDCNQAAMAFFECRPNELSAKTIRDFSFCKNQQRIPSEELLAASKVLQNLEAEVVLRDRIKTLLVNFVPLNGADRTMIYAIGQDITERKTMERDISLAHTELNQIFQTASVGMRLIDKDFNVLKINETFATLSGTDIESAIGKKCYDVFAGPQCHKPACPLTQILRGKSEIENEDEKLRSDGQIVHCLITARPFVGPDGDLVGIVESFKDISELKRAQEALRSERDKLHRILFQRVEGAAVVNADFGIEYQNGALKRQMGNCLQRKCYRVFRDRNEPCEDCNMMEAINTGKLKRHEFDAANGITYEQTYTPFEESDGQHKVVVAIRDITETKASRAAVYRSEQLAALGELAAGVAHEINNPINGIINYAQIIIDKNGQSEIVKDIASRIGKESDRIARIVDSLLAFSRRERQSKIPADIDAILQDSLILIRKQMRKEGIDLQINVPSSLPPIFAIPQEVQQVIINILSNARYSLNKKYPERHTDKIIAIDAECLVLEGIRYVRLVFLDHGLGIPPEIIDKVMNPFFSTKPKGQGTGLGLSISQGIVNDHGGQLVIKSIHGHSASIAVDFPVANN